MALPWMLITGATDGVGLELARLFKSTHRLILVGRRPLEELTEPLFRDVVYCQTDLANSTQACHTIAACLHQYAITELDAVIHNAATGFYGPISEQASAGIHDVLEVNLRTPIALTQQLLPWLGTGKIVLISSVASRLPTPEYAVYSASKAALEAWSRALRSELAPAIPVQVIRLGATRTKLHEKLGIPREKMDWTRFPPVDATAKAVQYKIITSDTDAVIGWSNRVLWQASYWIGSLIERIGVWRSRFVS